MNFYLGEIYWLDIEYEDDPKESKRRPAIIIGKIANSLFILVSTTSQSPSDPPSYYDQFKIPILNWRKYGFSKPSWGLGYRLIRLTADELESVVKQEDFLGHMSDIDLKNLIEKIERIHQ